MLKRLAGPGLGVALGTAVLAAVVDQASKWAILAYVMDPPRVITVTPFFNLTLGFNRGVTFRDTRRRRKCRALAAHWPRADHRRVSLHVGGALFRLDRDGRPRFHYRRRLGQCYRPDPPRRGHRLLGFPRPWLALARLQSSGHRHLLWRGDAAAPLLAGQTGRAVPVPTLSGRDVAGISEDHGYGPYRAKVSGVGYKHSRLRLSCGGH